MKMMQNNFLAFVALFFFSICLYEGNLLASLRSNQSSIATDGTGNMIAVWTVFRPNGQTQVQGAVFNFGTGTWSTPFDLSDVTRHAKNPRMSINADGNAVIIWLATDSLSGIEFLEVVMLTSAGVVVDQSIISNFNEEPRSEHEIKIDDQGDIVAIWSAYIDSSPTQVVRFANARFGMAWSEPQTLSN